MRVTQDAHSGLIVESGRHRVLLPPELVASIAAPRGKCWEVPGELTVGEVLPYGIRVELPEIGEGVTVLQHHDPAVLEAALVELAIEHSGHLRRGADAVPVLEPGEMLLWAWPEHRVPTARQQEHLAAITEQAERGVRVVIATFRPVGYMPTWAFVGVDARGSVAEHFQALHAKMGPLPDGVDLATEVMEGRKADPALMPSCPSCLVPAELASLQGGAECALRCPKCGANWAEELSDEVIGVLLGVEEEPTAGYGAFKGGDPRTFEPDTEVCTAEELEAHRVACLEADAMEARGEVPDWPSSHGWERHGEVVMHVTTAGFGLGVYPIDGSPARPWVRPSESVKLRDGAPLASDVVVDERQGRCAALESRFTPAVRRWLWQRAAWLASDPGRSGAQLELLRDLSAILAALGEPLDFEATPIAPELQGDGEEVGGEP